MNVQGSRRGTKRACVVVLTALVWLALVALPAAANQGGLKKPDANDNGVRAALSGSANITNNSGIIGTVRIQKTDDGSSFGLYQFGWVKQGSNFSSSCGSGSMQAGMVERHYDNTSDNYLCNTYSGLGGGNYGDLYEFTIKHVGSGWEAIRENGNVLDGPYDLGFPGGLPYAVSEKYGTITSATMHFGPSGQRPWQRWDGSSWSTISTAQTFNGGGWSIGNPPSPFTISR